ncbi:MAG: sigma-54-dependent Fis family transcriptional regulator [Myxococcales bacterium]|nr:sigma-54-dependent Fis family transcriptional regulator [Myxococcales bacterium]
MTTIDDTLSTDPGDSTERFVGQPSLVITIVYHPWPRRIGDRAVSPVAAGAIELSRMAPSFVDPWGTPAGPLGDRRLSRRPLRLLPLEDGSLRIDAGSDLGWRLDGAEGEPIMRVQSADLRRGVFIELARRAVLHVTLSTPTEPARESFGLIGVSGGTERLRNQILQLAVHEVPVSIAGESGVGKELVAEAIHRASARASGPWVTVNVAALTPSMATAELFGHVRGAFTGAEQTRPGFFGAADGGTLFLDEIGDIPAEVQPKLLRALETGEIQPVGGRARRVDVRLVTATDADLEARVLDGRFMRSLLYRIWTTTIDIPPLRARLVDIPLLFVHFLAEQLELLGAADKLDMPADNTAPWLPRRLVLALLRHDWPGNVRELRSVALQVAIESHAGPQARLPDRFGAPGASPSASASASGEGSGELVSGGFRVVGMDPARLHDILRRNHWRLRLTARELGISRNTLNAMMGQLGFRRPGQLTAAEILAVAAEVGGEVDRIAERLQVSPHGLKLRMRALGMER